jgi:hypothetical protein
MPEEFNLLYQALTPPGKASPEKRLLAYIWLANARTDLPGEIEYLEKMPNRYQGVSYVYRLGMTQPLPWLDGGKKRYELEALFAFDQIIQPYSPEVVRVSRHFEDYVVAIRPVSHPLLEKVFPGVQFQQEVSLQTFRPDYWMIGLLDGERFTIDYNFNRLRARVAAHSQATPRDWIEAYIRLYHQKFDSSLTFTKFEAVDIPHDSIRYNYRVLIQLVYGNYEQKLQWFLAADDDEIIQGAAVNGWDSATPPAQWYINTLPARVEN